MGAWLSEEERSSCAIEGKYNPQEPLPQGISEAFFIRSLRKYGYECPESAYITPEHQGVVKAFKSHFSHNQHPEAYNTTIDQSALFWAWALNAKYNQNK